MCARPRYACLMGGGGERAPARVAVSADLCDVNAMVLGLVITLRTQGHWSASETRVTHDACDDSWTPTATPGRGHAARRRLQLRKPGQQRHDRDADRRHGYRYRLLDRFWYGWRCLFDDGRSGDDRGP